MFRFILMRHSTEEVVESSLHYKYPHTAFFGARDYVVDQLKNNTMQPNELLSLGVEDEKGQFVDAISITINFPASAMLKEKTYRVLMPRRQ